MLSVKTVFIQKESKMENVSDLLNDLIKRGEVMDILDYKIFDANTPGMKVVIIQCKIIGE